MRRLVDELATLNDSYLDACDDWADAILFVDKVRHARSGRGPASWTLPKSGEEPWYPPERGMIAVGHHRVSHIETEELPKIFEAHVSRHVRAAKAAPTLVQSKPFSGEASGSREIPAAVVNGEVVVAL
jgi:hypothetical protein